MQASSWKLYKFWMSTPPGFGSSHTSKWICQRKWNLGAAMAGVPCVWRRFSGGSKVQKTVYAGFVPWDVFENSFWMLVPLMMMVLDSLLIDGCWIVKKPHLWLVKKLSSKGSCHFQPSAQELEVQRRSEMHSRIARRDCFIDEANLPSPGDVCFMWCLLWCSHTA